MKSDPTFIDTFVENTISAPYIEKGMADKIMAAVDDTSITFASEDMNKIVAILRRNKCGLV